MTCRILKLRSSPTQPFALPVIFEVDSRFLETVNVFFSFDWIISCNYRRNVFSPILQKISMTFLFSLMTFQVSFYMKSDLTTSQYYNRFFGTLICFIVCILYALEKMWALFFLIDFRLVSFFDASALFSITARILSKTWFPWNFILIFDHDSSWTILAHFYTLELYKKKQKRWNVKNEVLMVVK